MEQTNDQEGVVQASRVILASPRTLFRAFIDAEAMVGWRAFGGVEIALRDFVPKPGGGYRMRLRYPAGDAAAPLQVQELIGEFTELAAEERVIEAIRPVQPNGSTDNTITLTTQFEPDRDGTRVTVEARGVPAKIEAEKQAAFLDEGLRSLALLTE